LAKTTSKTSKEVAMIEYKEISKEDVAHRAHELYVQRGCKPGKAVDDWVSAENELSSEVFVFDGSLKTKAAQVGRNHPN
jgi:Protein of unknown function (DUF2934)